MRGEPRRRRCCCCMCPPLPELVAPFIGALTGHGLAGNTRPLHPYHAALAACPARSVPGIGHRIKSKDNRDKRVELLQR